MATTGIFTPGVESRDGFKFQGIRQTALRPHITVNNVRINVRKVRVF